MAKKGQMTAFIIIGIILLLSLIIFIYFRQATLVEPEVIPAKFSPVKDYMSSCLYLTGRAAIERLGSQAGYIDIPEEWARQEDSYVSFGRQGVLKVPYWYYMGQSRVPSLGTMEQQMSGYIEANIAYCIDDFSAFANTFDIRPRDEIEVITIIDDEDVRFEATYPLRVRSKADAESITLSDFSGIVDVKLKQIHDTARAFLEFENANMVLENATIDMLSMDPDIPESGMTFDCTPDSWIIEDIKDELSDIMKYHLSRVRIRNTDYVPFEAPLEEYEYFDEYPVEDIFEGKYPDRSPPSDAYEYFHYFYDINIPETDLAMTLEYDPSWGMELDARPSYGGVLRSSVGSSMQRYLSFMCINFYHFTYDITYPVMGVVSDTDAFNNEGFIFKFAFPVLIRKNEGNRVDFGKEVYDVPLEYVDYCGSLSGRFYDISVTGMDEDGYMDMELNNFSITYDCYKYRCHLGYTAPGTAGYKLRTQLPSFCSHGYLVAEKPGYLKARAQVLDDGRITLEAKKLKRFNFTINMHDYQSIAPAYVDPAITPLKDDMSVLINIESYDEPGFFRYVVYPFSEDTPEDSKEIELIEDSGNYMVDIMVTDEKIGIIGGYRANWTIGLAEMQDTNNIDFHVIRYLPVPIATDDQYGLIKFLEENQEYKMDYQPQFSYIG